nr:hypothetical protein [uncultured Rhodopila sp.]
MTVKLQLTGYDKATDRVQVDYVLPLRENDLVKQLAGVQNDDPEVARAYPLTEDQAVEIACIAGTSVNPGQYHYFLEAF